MSASRYLPSTTDGLPARVSGGWAREKLAYLAKYMHLFSVGMKFRWPRRVYLDLLAGPGRCIQRDTLEEFDGSPIVALQCQEPFTEAIFIEEDAQLAAALGARVQGRAEVVHDNCNRPEVIEQLRTTLQYNTLGLAFIDNLGLDVPLNTIRQITDQRRVDLFIVFQTQDLKRNIRDALGGADSEARWDAFFGNAKWKDVARAAMKTNASAEEIATALLDFYAEQLEGLGYDHIAHSRRVMKNSRAVELYRLILAGKHALAVEFFEKVSAIDPYGQRNLLF